MIQLIEIIKEFSKEILEIFWNNRNVLIWNVNKPFTSLIGSELLLFITNIDAIVEFMRCKFVDTPTVKSICNVLLLWEKITPFLVITTIENENAYKQKMLEFKQNVKKPF